jgi:hypothetical protein
MAGPGGSLDESNLDESNRPKNKVKRSVCDTCGLIEHATRRARGCKYSINVLSTYCRNLPPATDTESCPAATVAAESVSVGCEIADSVNYEKGEKQDGEFSCRSEMSDAKHVSKLRCLLVLTLTYGSTAVSAEGIEKYEPCAESRQVLP